MRRALAAALLALAAAAAAHAQANAEAATDERRAEALVILASRKWECSYEITERKENRRVVKRPDRIFVRYRMPPDRDDFVRARECVYEGLRLAGRAVALAPKNPEALSHKANLLREAAKLAEMEGDAARADEYNRLYEEALQAQKLLADELRRAAGSGGQSAASAGGPPSPRARKTGITHNVLNGKAVSKPQPDYPEQAKAARAEGTVIVQVDVDEAGNVVAAEAVSGHPLLRGAAESAARAAKIRQTLLSGRPVRVSGILTYNFVLR